MADTRELVVPEYPTYIIVYELHGSRIHILAVMHGRQQFKSISMDHTVRKQDGGTDSPDNMQLTHPYCNSGYKELMAAKAATPKD